MITCGWWRTFISVGPLVSEIELQQVMVPDMNVALVLKGLKDPVGWYTGGTSDCAGLESRGLCLCCVYCARQGILSPKASEGKSVSAGVRQRSLELAICPAAATC